MDRKYRDIHIQLNGKDAWVIRQVEGVISVLEYTIEILPPNALIPIVFPLRQYPGLRVSVLID